MHKATPDTASDRFTLHASYALLALVVLVMAFIRVRFLAVPLERDEGEYAYAGQLILSGVDPYRFCYTMKLPGTAAAYALIMAIFGQTPVAIHFGLLLVNAGTAALLCLLGRQLFGPLAGAAAGACYAVLSASPSVLGLAAHATQFVVLPAVGGLLLLLVALERGRLRLMFASGLLLGLAFVVKQPGLFFVLFALGYLMLRSRGKAMAARAGAFLAGAALPVTLTCLLIAAAGGFQTFWFWIYDYARSYGTTLNWFDAVELLEFELPIIVLAMLPALLLATFGAMGCIFDPALRRHALFLSGLLLFSCAALSVGFYFRKHYFVLLLPALSLFVAAGFSALLNLLVKSGARVPALLAVALSAGLLALSVFMQRGYFFTPDPQGTFMTMYASNPFVEAQEIAAYLERRSGKDDRIAVIGSEPEIYFYAHRRSASGYVYMYPLVDRQPFALRMQKEMEAEIEASRPKFMVFVTTKLSWLVKPEGDVSIIGWSERYARDHYRMVGVSDNLYGKIEYHWQDAERYQPKSIYTVFIFERKD